jgi:hypothetical protein
MYIQLSHVHVTKISLLTPDGRVGGGRGTPPGKKSGAGYFFFELVGASL